MQVAEMDEVIFEEFKGTGNMEIHLNRKLTDRNLNAHRLRSTILR